mgnify:CR=1 FL=1
MENFKNHIKPFGLFSKKPEKDPMKPSYIKPDGTKVIEQDSPTGKVVYEISPDCTLICRSYDKKDRMYLDYIRRRNLEIGHTYDEYGKKIYEFNSLYDENNVLAKKTEIEFKYYDEGGISEEVTIVKPGDIKTEIHYDKTGKQTEKIEYIGSVKTWFDENNKPIKRQIDRGSGGIVTEDLNENS